MQWIRRFISALDWYGRIVLLGSLGVGGAVSAAVTIAASTVAAAPLWLQVAMFVSILLIVTPAVAGIGLYGLRRWQGGHERKVTTLPSPSYFSNQRLYVADLVRDVEAPIIKDKTFEDCTLVGPAVLAPRGTTVLQNNNFEGPLSSFVYEIPEERFVIGIIGLEDCVVRRCRFEKIGLMGPSGFSRVVAEGSGMKFPQPVK